ncbi:MAG: SDR family NAD(P)-dependent oxidoreductase [Bacteroidota bacterium]
MALSISQKFPNKRAFITGAASGLGKAFCAVLAKDNWTLVMADVNEAHLQEAEKDISAMGAQTHTYVLDVTDRETYFKVAEDVAEKLGGMDLLINNAGVGDGGPFHQYDLQNWDWMIGINLTGVVHGSYFFAPHMLQAKSGHIINIASAASFTNAPFMAPYNATKAAVRSLSETLYYEYKEDGIGVTAVLPTFFPTNIMESARGPKSHHMFAKKMMERSTITAEGVALEVLDGAAKGKMEVILPKIARRTYFLKKWFPKAYEKQVMRLLAGQKKIDKSFKK